MTRRLVSLLSLPLVASVLLMSHGRVPSTPTGLDPAGTVSACVRCGYCVVEAASSAGSCCQHGDASDEPLPCDGTCCVLSSSVLLVVLPECLRLPASGPNGTLELPESIWQSRSDAPPVPPPWS